MINRGRYMIIHSEQIKVCQLERNDWRLLHTWLSNPVVAQYYEGRDVEMTKQFILDHYFDVDDCTRCLVYFEEQAIGYMQFYEVEQAFYDSFHYSSNEVIYGMDQFIGVPEFWNKGIGTEMIRLVVDYLFRVKKVNRIVMDPQVSNARAIHTYEKVGFKKLCKLQQHEQHEGEWRDCWLMEIKQ